MCSHHIPYPATTFGVLQNDERHVFYHSFSRTYKRAIWPELKWLRLLLERDSY